jgi:cellulose synthase/poly-beta-1,6-N-acetylglucosamine synthase-like glycosyltransferase
LVLVRKSNGGRADALNVGVNAAQYPLVCMVDADSILDPDALLTVSKPFADDPLRVVATGGVIRAVNGCRVRGGRVVDVRMPRDWVARIQVVEYLRAFLLGRTGWSKLGALSLISGAFGLFRRDVVVAVGGFDPDSLGEDFELVTHIHRHMREQKRSDYRVVFVAEPVSWTEVPSTLEVLGRQRRRWHRGLTQVLWRHRVMLMNPRYGRIGLLALPYYVAFELVAPVLELAGIVLVPAGLLVGAVNTAYAGLFLAVAYGYAIFVSIAALAVEEFSFHRYSRWRDLGAALLAAVAENVGYRQLTCWWRIQGLVAELAGRKAEWGVMTRTGFESSDEVTV